MGCINKSFSTQRSFKFSGPEEEATNDETQKVEVLGSHFIELEETFKGLRSVVLAALETANTEKLTLEFVKGKSLDQEIKMKGT